MELHVYIIVAGYLLIGLILHLATRLAIRRCNDRIDEIMNRRESMYFVESMTSSQTRPDALARERSHRIRKRMYHVETAVNMIRNEPDTKYAGDWTEDNILENGNHLSRCIECDAWFHGRKNRFKCRTCSPLVEQSS